MSNNKGWMAISIVSGVLAIAIFIAVIVANNAAGGEQTATAPAPVRTAGQGVDPSLYETTGTNPGAAAAPAPAQPAASSAATTAQAGTTSTTTSSSGTPGSTTTSGSSSNTNPFTQGLGR